MISRRTAIIQFLSTLSALALSSKNTFACTFPSSNPETINISIPKETLKNFYFGKMEDLFRQEYNDFWYWSEDVVLSPTGLENETYLVENKHTVPINISHKMNFNENEIFCSRMDIIYADERSTDLYVMYSIASIDLKQIAIPYFSTRIRMSSSKAKIYAALTFRNIKGNKIKHVQISNLPRKLEFISCSKKFNFWYVDT
jgi:hypothetical protein